MIDIETQLRSYQHAMNIRGETREMCSRAADEIVRLRAECADMLALIKDLQARGLTTTEDHERVTSIIERAGG